MATETAAKRVPRDSPVAERGDEIEAAVNSIVDDVSAIKTALVVEVALKLVINVADDGAETGGETHTDVPQFIQPQNTCIKSKRGKINSTSAVLLFENIPN